MSELKANNGGVYDNDGLIDTLIVDCNMLPKHLIDNQFVAFGSTLAQMVQKLRNLKKGIRNDTDSLKEQISDLNKELDRVYALLAQRGKGEESDGDGKGTDS